VRHKEETAVDRTIVMIHGMMGGAWCWDEYRSYFEDRGYKCVTPTLRYHDVDPASPPHPHLGSTSLLDYAQDLTQEIEKLGERPILMGHSMGGLLAQIVGSRGLAEALVLLTPAPPAGINMLRPTVIRAFWSAQRQWGFWRKPLLLRFEPMARSALQLFTPEDQRDIYGKFVHDSGRAAAEIGYWFLDRRGASRVDESKITCPVLAVAGGQDGMMPHPVVRKVAEKYRAVSTYRMFADHSHQIISEPGWQDVAEYVANWLRDALRDAG